MVLHPDLLRRGDTRDYGGHVSSDAVATATRDEPARRPRQEETFRKLLGAALETLRESSYSDLTVRGVAARAQVAPATAYTYFSSKNHLIAEVYLDLVREVGYFTDVNDTRVNRVQQALRSLALVVADEPEVAAACTTAMATDRAKRGRADGSPESGPESAEDFIDATSSHAAGITASHLPVSPPQLQTS